MKLVLQILIILVLSSRSYAEVVTIGGSAPNFSGSTAHLYIYDDFITYNYKRIGSEKIDSVGRFSFALEIKEIKMAFIRISGVNGKLFLEPGGLYNIEFPKPQGLNTRAVHNRTMIELLFTELSENDLNYLIIDYNTAYENFFAENYKKLAEYKRSGRVGYQQSIGTTDTTDVNTLTEFADAPLSMDELITGFQSEINEKYKGVNNDYLKSYIDYSFAAIRTSATMSRKRAFEDFIDGKPLLFNHHEYVSFVNDFFEGHFIKSVMEAASDSLGQLVHAGQGYNDIVSILSRHDFLHNQELCEFVVITGLFKGFYRQDFDRSAIIRLLKAAKENTEFESIQTMSSNMYAFTTRLRRGFPAFNFELKNRDDEVVSLESFKGKYVYLAFYADWCSSCLAEMKAFPEFHKKYGKDIAFVCVSLDQEQATMENFVKKNRGYRWEFLHHANQPELKDQYDIQAIPAFVFIDPEGKIISARELKPSEIVEKKFFDIHKTLHPRSKLKVGGEPPEKSVTNRGGKRK